MSSSSSSTQNATSSTSQNYTARRRLEALVEGLSSPADFERKPAATHSSSPTTTASSSAELDTSASLPAIRTYAGPSAGPRTRDRVVVVTGANSVIGIGRAAASQFAQNGARAVYVCDWDDEHLAAQKREIEAENAGCTIHPVKLDVGDERAVQEVMEDAVTRYGRLDVVFANAGVSGGIGSFETTDADEYMSVMRVNALGVFLCFKQGAIAMKKCIENGGQVGGSLIGTASVAGLRSNAGGTVYSASKAAVVSMAQTMAYQLVGTGIRVNAVCPGLIDTGMTAPVFDSARSRGTTHKIGQINPTRRGGIADEIARVALFLGSDEASYVNGQAWAVCGGLSAGHPFVPGKIA